MTDHTASDGKNKTQNEAVESSEDLAQPNYWLMNKNLGNFPLARDPRAKVNWRRSKTGCWRAQLPGEPRISLRLPPDAPEEVRRAPRAFDIKVLAALLTLARTQDAAVVSIRSQSWLLDWMGMARDSRSLRKLHESLEFWCWLRIVHQRWYLPNDGHDQVRLPPPLKRHSNLSKKIRVSKKWREMGEAFVAPIPLPLPDSAGAQNLVLWLMTGKRRHFETIEGTVWVGIRTLANKIGMSQVNPWSAMIGVCEQAAQWFRDHGGSLEPMIGRGKVVFITTDPKVPQSIQAAPQKWIDSRKAYQKESKRAHERQQRELKEEEEKERREQEKEDRRMARSRKRAAEDYGYRMVSY